MAKQVDMSGFDSFTDNLESYVNKQGCTLGSDAERLQKLMYSIHYCDIVNIGLHFFLKNVRPYAASCSEA